LKEQVFTVCPGNRMPVKGKISSQLYTS
jgi:hypothetical protein